VVGPRRPQLRFQRKWVSVILRLLNLELQVAGRLIIRVERDNEQLW